MPAMPRLLQYMSEMGLPPLTLTSRQHSQLSFLQLKQAQEQQPVKSLPEHQQAAALKSPAQLHQFDLRYNSIGLVSLEGEQSP